MDSRSHSALNRSRYFSCAQETCVLVDNNASRKLSFLKKHSTGIIFVLNSFLGFIIKNIDVASFGQSICFAGFYSFIFQSFHLAFKKCVYFSVCLLLAELDLRCERPFSSCGERRAAPRLCVRASHCSGFSCGAQALGHVGFSSCGARAQLPHGTWDLPRLGFEPVSLILPGGFL